MRGSKKLTTAELISEIDKTLEDVSRLPLPSDRIKERAGLLAKRSQLVKKLINEVKK